VWSNISVLTLEKVKLNGYGELLSQFWNKQDGTEWTSVLRINISVSVDTGQDKHEWLSLWGINISVLTLHKIKMADVP